MSVRTFLLVAITVLGLGFLAHWVRTIASRQVPNAGGTPTVLLTLIGFVVNFFDTLGIGSFATTTAAFKMFRLVPDERIPGTMIVGLVLPVVTQALIFIASVRVDSTVLLSLIAATIVGGWIGAGVVTRLPRRPIQLGMGIALIVAGTFMALSQLGVMPAGGTALGLPAGKLAIAIVVNVVLGALLMLGIGNYGPCLVLLSLLGMDPRAAFPIMMGAGALAALVGGWRFVRSDRYDGRSAMGLFVGGIPGVLIAGLVVKEMSLDVLRWMVVVVVAYAAFTMLRSARRESA